MSVRPKMHYLFITLTVFSCILMWSKVYSYEFNNGMKNVPTDSYEAKGGQDCILEVIKIKDSKMPIPFTSAGKIIYPNSKGQLIIKHKQSFQLGCMETEFATVSPKSSEITVTCLENNLLEYRSKKFKYETVQCKKVPKSKLRVTKVQCQKKYTMLEIGFQTKKHFLNLYYICFDIPKMNSVYTWYDSRLPYYDEHQILKNDPSFIKSNTLYGNTDVNTKYSKKGQLKTLESILGSEAQAKKFIQTDEKSVNYLARGHYAAKTDFCYAYQEGATFYYANVAPQWQSFNAYSWFKVENAVRRDLHKYGSSRHVIVAGTYGICTLPDVNGVQKPLYIDFPKSSIPVPLFFWKLSYNTANGVGIVYIGLNNPYKTINKNVDVLCPNVCPNKFKADEQEPDADQGEPDADQGEPDADQEEPDADQEEPDADQEEPDADQEKAAINEGLVYCCTKKEFEKVYGEFDPIIFQKRTV